MSDSTTIQLRFDDMSHEEVEVVPSGARRFRLQDTPAFATDPVFAGDVIEAAPLADGTHRFIRVLERAPLRHYSWVLPRGWSDSPVRDVYLARVEAAGGTWEQLFGGVLFVHIPVESSFDAEAELDRYLKSDSTEA